MGNWAFIGEQIGSLMGANYLRRGYDKSLAKAAERLRSEVGATEADKEKAYQNIMANYGFTGLDGKSFGKEIEASKLGYDAAKAQDNQAGMDMYHNRANMLREIGKSQGWDMTGLGAGDTLESVQGILSQAAGAAPTSLGNSNPQSMLFGDMSLNAAVNNMYSKPTLGGALGSMPGQFFPMESAPPKMTLTEDMLKNYFMSSGTVDKEAAAFAEARRNDPRYLDQLEIDLISQGLDANAVRTVIGKEKQQRMLTELEKCLRGEDFNGAFLAGLKLTEDYPVLSQAVFTGVPTPKENWNVGVARDNMKIEQGYSRENAKIKHEYKQQDAADDFTRSVALKNLDFDQQKEFARHAAEVKRYLSNATIEDRIKTMRALGIPEEMINMSVAGVKRGSANNNGQSQAVKNALSYIKLKQEENKNSFDPEWQTKDPNYQKAIQIVAGSLEEQEGNANTGGGANTGGAATGTQGAAFDPNNYESCMNDAGEILTAIKNDDKRKNMPIENIVRVFKDRYGDLADAVIAHTDWSAWGYKYNPVLKHSFGQSRDFKKTQ